MLGNKLKYFTLIIFLVSVGLIVFLQFNSGQSINALNSSNTRLWNELRSQRELQVLETGIISIESNVRGAVITGRSDHLKNTEEEIENIRSGMDFLERYFSDPATDSLVHLLGMVVERKITHSKSIIDEYYQSGKDAAEALIVHNRGKAMTDTIVSLIGALNDSRQSYVRSINETIADNGEKARTRGMFLAIVAAISCVFAFFYVIAISRKQQRLIAVLNESEKREKESARIKEQFLSNMSHEIRTPLNAILGFCNLLQKTSLTPEQSEYTRYMQVSGNNLLTIVNDILDLSKIEAGMLRIEKSPFHFPSTIESIEGMFQEKAIARGLDFETIIDPNIPEYFVGDSFRLTQVLSNILGNAIKFTQQGHITLQVRLMQLGANEARIRFDISDTGIGIEENKQQIIFDRFQQAESDTTRKFGGTGLGLSIVKQLVDLLNGQIEVNSQPGMGSRFSVILPFGVRIAKTLQVDNSLPKPFVKKRGNGKVLVAEDNELNRQLIRHLFALHQIPFTMVNDGREVLEELKQFPYDLLLMDIQMPVMDGYTTAKHIRNELQNDIHIVAMTAYAMQGDREKCLAAGINDYITKPIQEEELLNAIYKEAVPLSNGKKRENAKATFNRAYLTELSGGNENFEMELLKQVEIQLPEELSSLQEALASTNHQQVHAITHSLKSTLGYVGLSGDYVLQLLTDIEKQALHNDYKQARESFNELDAICRQALTEIG